MTAFIVPSQMGRRTTYFEQLRDLLEQYARHSPRFHYEIVDPVADPMRAQMLKVQQYGTLVFQAGDNQHNVTEAEFVEYDFSSPYGQQRSKFKGEQAFTSAILKVTRGSAQKVYFLAGHDELDPEAPGENSASGLS